VDDESHEITAIAKWLEILELAGAIVAIDAMGGQKETAEKIRARGADYVLAAKDDRPHLLEDLSDHFAEVLEDGTALPSARRRATKEKDRGRLERRISTSTPVAEDLRDRRAWRDLKSVGRVISVVRRAGRETVEVRYFINGFRV
jgi:predicted transposase YbfD/YdcC